MLLRQVLDQPVDTSQQIIDRGLIPVVTDGANYIVDHLKQSPNPVYKQLAKIAIVPKDWDDKIKILKDDVLRANTHIYLVAALATE